MTSKLTNAERRRLERQRRRTLNIIVVSGISLIAAGLVLYIVLRPIDDLVEITPQTYPVPVDGLMIGNPDAPVLLEAFEDFQCPACKQFTDQIKQDVMEAFIFTGVARVHFRHNPFLGGESVQAANAAMCANDQDRFWDFHEMLFANQLGENIGSFSDRRLSAMADLLGLDMDAWSACYNSEAFEEAIQADLDEARSRGVTGTPTLFVNGEMLDSYDFNTIQTAINAAAAEE